MRSFRLRIDRQPPSPVNAERPEKGQLQSDDHRQRRVYGRGRGHRANEAHGRSWSESGGLSGLRTNYSFPSANHGSGGNGSHAKSDEGQAGGNGEASTMSRRAFPKPINVAIQIDLGKYSAGVYLITVEDGERRIVERVVKQ